MLNLRQAKKEKGEEEYNKKEENPESPPVGKKLNEQRAIIIRQQQTTKACRERDKMAASSEGVEPEVDGHDASVRPLRHLRSRDLSLHLVCGDLLCEKCGKVVVLF